MQDQRIATILWRGKWLILASFVIAVALALFATSNTAKVYQAAATIQVNSGNSIGPSTPNPADVVNANQGLASTYATLITDRSFLQKIRAEVYAGRLSTSTLEQRLSAKAIDKTALVELTAEGPSPDAARSLAQGVAELFIREVRSDAADRTAQLQDQIQRQIQQLDNQIQASATKNPEELSSLRGARAELVRQLAQLVAGQIAQGGSVTLTAPPTASATPIRPRPVLNLLAGGLLGLLIGFGLSLLRLRLDRGLHSSAEAEELLGVPILAAIPERRRFSLDDAVLGEAYDVLRANLNFLSLDNPLRSITFTSYNPREGKTSTVEGLAYAAVRGGMSVCVVDGDVRTSTLSSEFGYASAPGLTNIVVGLATLSDVLVQIEPGLTLLPSGPTPPNPPSVLSSQRVREIFGQIRGKYDLILIDCPPVANLADASLLASYSDGIVLVSRVGVTNRADLGGAASNLRHSPTPVVGAVVLEPRDFDETYYPAKSRLGRPSGAEQPKPRSRRRPRAGSQR